MLKQKKLIFTLGIFLVLLIYFLITQTGGKGFNTLKLPPLPLLKAEEIERIEINRPPEHIVLGKKDHQWNLIEPIQFSADKDKTESLKKSLAELRLTDIISERPGAEADYGLTTVTAIQVKVAGKSAKPLELTFGSANSSATHTFVQLPKDPRVYQVFGDLNSMLGRKAADWRSLQIFDFSTDLIRSVSITRTGKPALNISKSEEVQQQIVKDSPKGVTPAPLPSRTIWKAKGNAEPLNDPKVNQWLSSFARLTAVQISERTPKAGKPLASITFKTFNQDNTLEFLEFLAKEKRYLVRKSGTEVVYELDEYQAQNLLKEIKDLL